jgi:hypothetical protein
MIAFRINNTEIVAAQSIGLALKGYIKESGLDLDEIETVEGITDAGLNIQVMNSGPSGELIAGLTIREHMRLNNTAKFLHIAGEE